MNDITFIIPNRGGENINFVIKKIKEFYPESKIIVITQDNDKPFCRGQLFNIAYNYVNTEYMCFIDNDMFFPKYVDLIYEYNKLNCTALQPFVNIQQVKVTENSYDILSENRKNICGRGGVTFINKTNFENVYGYSNLYVGYGNEDTDFDKRCSGILDINIPICHITHKKRSSDWHWEINKQFYNDFDKRNVCLDSYKNTTYNVTKRETIDGIDFIYVNNIYVDDKFSYKELLNKHYK